MSFSKALVSLSKIINMAPQSYVNLGPGYTGATEIVDWDHSQQKNPGFYHSTFGDSVINTLNRYPFQTLTTSAGTSSGTKYTFDTQILADRNLVATWFLRVQTAATVITRIFIVLAENANGPTTAATFYLYERNSANGTLTASSVIDTNFSATQSGGYLRLIADNLDTPSLAGSIVRVL